MVKLQRSSSRLFRHRNSDHTWITGNSEVIACGLMRKRSELTVTWQALLPMLSASGDHIAKACFEGAAAQEAAGNLRPNDGCETILLGKGSEHFAGARCVLVYQNHVAAVESSRPQISQVRPFESSASGRIIP